ncbi:LysR family transcriptional regulator [Algiphilus sp. W345]|uniref:LysR family transcriptional regulator n=1 Tax=Banduia mediterranea TaxID=3075609 RepID=A0ABU2WJA3_9GAMM|nr:LysR family transcriptional regulator [Algiphilus sp. W345]MDT0497319.1 LysR family transcriptional regulator [Algiphilus sp. W345]
MDLRQLRYFAAIVEEGSLSRAAARLHVSQPPLSTHLKALEREIGAALLVRGNRGVTPTAAGAVFYEEVRAVLSRLEQAQERALQVHRGDVGVLSVGFVSIADYSILPPALSHFRARCPRVEVQLHELTTDAQIRELRAGRLDLAIGLAPVDEPDLRFERLRREALILAAPEDHPAAQHSDPVDLRSLAKASFIVPPRAIGPGLYDLVISRCRAAGFVPRITQSARQMQTVIGLVSAGMGVALVPSSVQNLQRAGVRYLPLSGRSAKIELGILRRDADAAPLAQNFIETLRGLADAAPS